MSNTLPRETETIMVNRVEFAHRDIAKVVNDFYTQIQFDPILAVPFRSVHDWPEHIRRLTHFWWIRMGGKPYLFSEYNPVGKHFFAGFNRDLLSRWLSLFHETLGKNLNPAQAELWMAISEQMGRSLLVKNELFKSAYESSQQKHRTDSTRNQDSDS